MTALSSRTFGALLFACSIALLLSMPEACVYAQAASAESQSDRETVAGAREAEGQAERNRADERDRTDERDRADERDDDSDDSRERRDSDDSFEWDRDSHKHVLRLHGHGDTVVNIGRNSDLPAGSRADAVISIFGSASNEGETRDVVSILGNTRSSGRVENNAVAVLGNTYIDSSVGGDVVAVLGNVELGPHADVGGDVAAVGGTVIRDPAAAVHGGVQSIGGIMPGFGWARPWIDHCLLYGRPLALVPGIGWAWTLALSFLALYVAFALLFRGGLSRCASTVETQPGMTLVAALLTVLLTPILIVLLCITVIGIAAIPFVLLGLFCAGLFGKAVMLACIGRRVTGGGSGAAAGHPALAVLIGGLIVLVLYLVPVLGFLVYKLLGLFGLGAVVYTLILAARARRPPPQPTVGASYATAAAESPGPGLSSTTAGTAAAGIPAADAASATAQTGAPLGAAAGAAASGAVPAQPAASPAAPAITATLPRAGFWIRMAALLLDALLIGVLTSVLHHDVELLVLAAYGALMWKLRGSTIGGIVFDLQVVRLDGRPVDWETAIVRALACFLSLAVAGLGFFWIAFDGGKQAWHDKIAGTVVVRVPKGISLV